MNPSPRNHWTKAGVLLLAVLFMSLSACDKQPELPANTDTGSDADSRLVLSANGVGPVNANTPFNLRQINAAFESYGLGVEEYKTFAEGKPYPVIRVSAKADVLMIINPDVTRQRVFSVMVRDNRIGNTFNHRIGQRYGDIYSYGQTEECAPGVEELSGQVLCYAPRSSHVLYLFQGNWDGATNLVPPNYVLSEWELAAMIWKPKMRKLR